VVRSRLLSSRVRAVVAFGLLFLACVAPPVLAESETPSSEVPPEGHIAVSDAVIAASQEPAISPEAPADAPPPVPTDAQPPEDTEPQPGATEELEAEMEAAEREEEKRRDWLETPEARLQRAQSRTAFDDLSAPEAQELIAEAFADRLKLLNGDPSRVLSDLQIEAVLGVNGALVPDGEGGSMLVESPIPVRAERSEEKVEPVDLALEEVQGGFLSRTPATDVRLPATSGEPIELGQDLAIASLSADGNVGAARYGDKDLFFANTGTDTDTFVAPLTKSVEILEQLRSPKSPEQFRYGLSIPDGAKLRLDGMGGAEVIDSSDERIAFVPMPYATDAQGTDVPVAMTVDGGAVVVEVPHRSLDLAYPILLDPELVLENWPWGGNAYGLDQWAWQETADYENGHGCTWTCWGSGLYARSKGSNFWYGPNTFGHWTYSAPNYTAYISAATFLNLRGNVYNCWSYQPHGYVGLYNVNSGTYNNLGVYSPLSFSAPSYDTGWVGGLGTRLAVVGIGTANAPSQMACGHDFYVGGAMIYQDDPESPAVSVTGAPPGVWIAGSWPFTLVAEGWDPGLGIRKMTLTRDGSPHVERLVGCVGTAGSRCPASRIEYFNLSGLGFDEGRTNAAMTVEDVTGRKTTQGWQMFVDRTDPDVVLTGQLARVTEEDEGGEQGDEEVEELSLPVYNLDIKATDVGSSGTADQRMRSGVRKLEIKLDGVPKQDWTQPCAFNCAMEQSYSLKLNNLETGVHTLEVIATDGVGNFRKRTIEFEFIPATGMKEEYVLHRFALPDGQGDEAAEMNPDRPELAVNVVNGNLVYREKDIEIDGYGATLEVERYYNSLLPDEEDTEWGHGWTLAQTPDLEPTPGPGTPTEATMVRASGAVEGSVELPSAMGAEKFDPELQAVVTKEPGGGFAVEDASGETDTALAFDDNGQVEELRTEGEAAIDYEYDSGNLAEIVVEDPASFSGTPEEAAELEESAKAPTPVASLGTSGSGNGQFHYGPGGVERDSKGNFWVADTRNRRIQQFDPDFQYLSQIDKTGAGENEPIYASALAIDSEDNVWVGDWAHHRVEVFEKEGDFVRRFGSRGAEPGQFEWPEGIAIDADDNVWVADKGNGRVQKFDPEGNLLKVIGTKGAKPGQLLGPQAVDIAPDGNAWVVDWSNHKVSVFDSAGTFLFRFGSQGSADGQFHHPVAISVDNMNRVWVADQVNNRVQQFNQQGEYVRQFGTTGSGEGQFSFVYPADIETDESGSLWITDANNERIKQWSLPGEDVIAPVASLGTSGSGNGQFHYGPGGVERDSKGNFWVADTRNRRIQQFDPDFQYLSQIDKTGAGENEPIYASALAIDSEDNVWVGDWAHHRVEVFEKEGDFVRRFGSRGAEPGQFEWPEGIAIDADDNVWVADKGNGRVQKFDPEGNLLKVIGTKGAKPGQLLGPQAVDIAPDGNAWVVDWSNHKVSVFDSAGTFLFRFGSQGSADGQFHHPVAISVDNMNRVWVADQVNNRVQQFNQQGEYVRQFGTTGSGEGQFSFVYPADIETDESGSLWITDANNERIQWAHSWRRTLPVQDPEAQDDPAVEVEVDDDLVSSVAGEEAGEHSYEHSGELLTSHEDADGVSTYAYDGSDRLTKVTLPNGTWAEISYGSTDGRVSSVTVRPAGAPGAKTTSFTYKDEPRTTKVTLPEDPAVTYEIGEDGSIFKWWNAKVPPEFEDISGTLYDLEGKETANPIAVGTHNLIVQAYSEHGIASIQILANGNRLLSEKSCQMGPSEDCRHLDDEWVTHTGDHAPGILYLEMVIEDQIKQVASQRFWVNVPYTPPPPPGQPATPKFADVLRFREAHGLDLDLDPVHDEFQINDRVFDTINDWIQGNPVAVASMERWGAPLRTPEVAELEYRLAYWQQASEVIPGWVASNASGSFAGFYLDERAGGKIVVGFTGSHPGTTLAALEQNAGLMAGPERIIGFAKPPQHTLASLESLRGQVSAAAAGYPAGLINRIRVDVVSNSIKVGASDVAQAQGHIHNSFGFQAPITVSFNRHGPESKTGRQRTTGAIRAGDELMQKYWIVDPEDPDEEEFDGPCTAGFGAFERAKKPGTGDPVLRLFALTAGHCAGIGRKVWRRPHTYTNGDPQVSEIGKVTRSGLETLFDVALDTDAAAIRLESPNLVPRKIYQEDGMPLIEVKSVWSPTLGTNLCFSGRRSEERRCGPVVSLPEETTALARNSSAATVEMCFRQALWGGDSGSPVWVEGTGVAVGIANTGEQDPDEPEYLPVLEQEIRDEIKEEEQESGEPAEPGEYEERVRAEVEQMREDRTVCFATLKPYPDQPADASVFGDPLLAPLHLVTVNNARP
jgi:YD repeat-containing protein